MSDLPAPFILNLLGPFRLTAPNGDRIAISSRKGVALIGLLAMATEGERTRAWLQDRLWGTRDQDHGRASLRSEIAALRACLGPHSSTLLMSERDRVRLDLRQISVDAHAYFLGEAEASERSWPPPGDFLEGLDLPGEDGFEEWLRDQRSALLERASRAAAPAPADTAAASAPRPPRRSICVLPFANMSADAEQDYFSDGISEDVITDLSKVSSLSVTPRNAAFGLKGQAIDERQVASRLRVEYVLAGSVRKAGNRLRINAHLTDGAAGGQIWAERWDRDLVDIFALQDEISQAVVAALKVKLLPDERKAIERRGTHSSDAYNLYLMARQLRSSGNEGDPRREEEIIRLTRKATQIDRGYAQAWALMALSQTVLCFSFGRGGDDGLESAEKALILDPDLAEAHAIKARHLSKKGQDDEALAELEVALRLDPESWDANKEAGLLRFRQRRFADAVRYYEKATELLETDFTSPMLLVTCYNALGDNDRAVRAARIAHARAETASARDQSNGAAIATGCVALAVLGEAEQSRDWARRALLIDPENMVMRYNLACALSAYLQDADGALELLEGVLPKVDAFWLTQMKVDPDFDAIRNDPRFNALISAAESRLAEAGASKSAAP